MIISIPFKNFLFSGILFLAISVSMFAGMIYFAADTAVFIASSTQTQGMIVDYLEKDETGSDGREVKNYYPVIEYHDSHGFLHRFSSDSVMNYEVFIFIKAKESGFKNTIYTVPEINLRYNADNPSEVRASRSFFDLWGSTFTAAFLSVVFGLVGGTLIWFHRKTKSLPQTF